MKLLLTILIATAMMSCGFSKQEIADNERCWFNDSMRIEMMNRSFTHPIPSFEYDGKSLHIHGRKIITKSNLIGVKNEGGRLFTENEMRKMIREELKSVLKSNKQKSK